MNKGLIGIAAAIGALAIGVTLAAARYPTKVRKNTYVGDLNVGGLLPSEADAHIQKWWDNQKKRSVQLNADGVIRPLASRTWEGLGIRLDAKSVVEALPKEDFVGSIASAFGGNSSGKVEAKVKYMLEPLGLKSLAKSVELLAKRPRSARVLLKDGQVVRTPEIAKRVLDTDRATGVLLAAVASGSDHVDLPLKEGAKHIPDDQLANISDVVSVFATRFNAGNRPRASNIRLAASKLRGVVLAPGERLSFNHTVGQRTLKGGFQLAGVYKNGKHDVGIGGGICQVSTTLYNASLFANLKVLQRSNHSLPVPYVPLGRDATVDYGSLDLVIENTYSVPIAIDSIYEPGRLTFRVLGKKVPGMEVKLSQSNAESWSSGQETVIDRNLKPGTRRILEKGSMGHAVTTIRTVYIDGKVARHEVLSRSTYGGQDTVVAYNPAPRAPAQPRATLATPSAVPVVAPAGMPKPTSGGQQSRG